MKSKALISHTVLFAMVVSCIFFISRSVESGNKNFNHINQVIAQKEEIGLKVILPSNPIYVERRLSSEEKSRIKHLLNNTQNNQDLFQEFAKIAISKSDKITMENLFRAIEIVDVWYNFGPCILSKFKDENEYRVKRTKLETWTKATEGCCNDYAYALAGILTGMKVKNNFIHMPGHIANVINVGKRRYYLDSMLQAIIDDFPEYVNANTKIFFLTHEDPKVTEFRFAFLERYFSSSKELLDLEKAGMLYKPNLPLSYCLSDEALHGTFYKRKYKGQLYYLCNGILSDLHNQ